MKAKTFENLIRRIVREEIDYALRREIKSLKEDLRDEIKPIIKEQPITNKQSIPSNVKNSLKEKIMGKKPIKKQNFAKDSTLNDLLNETAQGDTNTQTAMAPITDPFSSSDVLPTDIMPTPVQKVVNRDYRSLMKAIDDKKNK
tara:strand:- start:1485 stop:1913 length:429 start_codon:yes stop_codon:yes gene_type:complete